MSAVLWLLVPLLAGVVAGVWACAVGRRRPAPPDRDTWADLDRFQHMRTALSADDHCKAA
ncbi:hypothetical protein [Streptomyces fumanus]|uniref:Uncharacterized protein n=1 Tax=Streptomyces fumanus TaxID=67302 RepID=A0A919ABQ3_9ACTN|nr:hypothetical protein [Streptomyces fumanus]GHE96618.1 hypothetical protein GCM10018772_20930 [Streptomyces fumanus]